MQEELDMLFLLEHFSLEDLVKAEKEYVNYEFRNTDNLTESYTEEKEFLDDDYTEFIITRDYYTIMNNFHYFGLFLDTETKNRLMDMLTDNIDYNIALGVADKIFIDHCTLLHVSQLHGNSEIYNYLNNRLEEKIQIVINGIGISDRAIAFRVDKHSVVCVNDIPHITIATFSGGKPVESNYITHWKAFGPIVIDVKLKKI